jgi:hypothetical protein
MDPQNLSLKKFLSSVQFGKINFGRRYHSLFFDTVASALL